MNASTAGFLTILVAIAGSSACLLLPRKWAIVPLCLALCVYPIDMLLPPDGAGLTAQRVIGVVLLLRCIFTVEIRQRFRWTIIDTAGATYFLLLLASQLMTTPFQTGLVNRAGFFLSAMVPFWCVRMLIVDRESLYAFLKGWLWVSVPLAIQGVYFMQTGITPYYDIMQFGQLWKGPTNRIPYDQRLFMGQRMFRAHAPFLQCIMFGWFFALWAAPCLNLFFEKRRLFPWVIGWVFLPLGCISAIAAGPMMLAAMSAGMVALFPFRRHWKVGVGAFLIGYLVIALGSNRTPMELVASLGMDASSSYFRVRLVNFTLRNMGPRWIEGWGMVPPHFYQVYDLCIQWVGMLVYYGLMGLCGFYGLVAVAGVQLWRAKKRVAGVADELLLWSLFGTLFASVMALFLVSLFAEMNYIFHMFVALAGSAPALMGSGDTRQIGVIAEVGGRRVLLRYTVTAEQRLALISPPRDQ